MTEKSINDMEREIVENYALFESGPIRDAQEIRGFFSEDELVRMFGTNIVDCSTMETGPYFTDQDREEYIALAIELWKREFKE